MTKHFVCCSSYLRNHTSYDCHLWYTCVKWWYLKVVFFHFFKILIFWVVSVVKEQKMPQNDKQLCLSHSISKEPCIIWFPFMVHMCTLMPSPDAFLFFQNFDFPCKVAKNEPKWQSTLSVSPHISGTVPHMIVVFGTYV